MFATAKRYWKTGIDVVPEFLSRSECAALSSNIQQYRHSHHLSVVQRRGPVRPLQYAVIDGASFDAVLSNGSDLVAQVQAQLEGTCGYTLALIDDLQAARNINIMAPGGQYQWHYDRNLVTAVVYLNSVDGGQTEFYPNYRLRVPGEHPLAVQQALDQWLLARPIRNLLGSRLAIAPTTGTLVAFRGNRTLHSVRPVEGNKERISLVLAFDRPRARRTRASLNAYLYEPGPSPDVADADSVPDTAAA